TDPSGQAKVTSCSTTEGVDGMKDSRVVAAVPTPGRGTTRYGGQASARGGLVPGDASHHSPSGRSLTHAARPQEPGDPATTPEGAQGISAHGSSAVRYRCTVGASHATTSSCDRAA